MCWPVQATDGCFYNDDAFMVCPPLDAGELEKLFGHEVFKMLKAEGKINDVVIENMMNWPPARRTYASESATADSMCIAAKPSGPIMQKVLKIAFKKFIMLIPGCVLSALDFCVLSPSSRMWIQG